MASVGSRVDATARGKERSIAFGKYANTFYHLEKADVILSLDADFLYRGTGAVRFARGLRRGATADGARSMNRLYVIEQSSTTTGAMADHRLAIRACDIEGFARALAATLDVERGTGAARFASQDVPAGWIEALAKDLQAHRGASR